LLAGDRLGIWQFIHEFTTTYFFYSIMDKLRYLLFKFLFFLSPLLFAALNPDLSNKERQKLEHRDARNQRQIFKDLSRSVK